MPSHKPRTLLASLPSASPEFRRRRGQLGGQTRARNYPPSWQRLLMTYASRRRFGLTKIRTFQLWLREQQRDARREDLRRAQAEGRKS